MQTTNPHPLKIGDKVWTSGTIHMVTAVFSSPKGQHLAVLNSDEEQEIIVDVRNDFVVPMDEEMEEIHKELTTLDVAAQVLVDKIGRKHQQLIGEDTEGQILE